MWAPISQPVPFSHKHHVGQLGIDCRYCHTGVEKSAYAGHPADRNVHDLPQPALHRPGDARAGAPEPRGKQARSSGRASTTCRTSCISTTRSTSTRASAAPPATGTSTRCNSSGRTRRSTWRGACNATGTRRITSADAQGSVQSRSGSRSRTQGKLDWAKQLVKDYHVQSSGVLTDCYTCHR